VAKAYQLANGGNAWRLAENDSSMADQYRWRKSNAASCGQ